MAVLKVPMFSPGGIIMPEFDYMKRDEYAARTEAYAEARRQGASRYDAAVVAASLTESDMRKAVPLVQGIRWCLVIAADDEGEVCFGDVALCDLSDAHFYRGLSRAWPDSALRHDAFEFIGETRSGVERKIPVGVGDDIWFVPLSEVECVHATVGLDALNAGHDGRHRTIGERADRSSIR